MYTVYVNIYVYTIIDLGTQFPLALKWTTQVYKVTE